MNGTKLNRKYLIVALLATILTATFAYGAMVLSSNHLTGTSGTTSLVLSGVDLNTTTILGPSTSGPTYLGDTFQLTANLTIDGSPGNGILVTFYDNNNPIGTGTTINGLTSINYIENNPTWDLNCTATINP